MTFAARSRVTIRDASLAYLVARYAAIGRQVLTVPGSDAYMLLDVLALEFEGLEQQAADLTRQLLPDQADVEFLDRHGAVHGIPREAATASLLSVQISGVALATVTFGTSVLVAPDGAQYAPTTPSVVLSGAGLATIAARASVPGSVGDQPVATVLTWSTTPLNANPTATVLAITTPGEDAESDADYGQRILRFIQERPASGNRSDWRDWTERFAGIEDAYVYPLMRPGTFATPTLGCVVVVALGPVPSDPYAPTSTRIPTPTTLTGAKDYIEGLVDANGVQTGDPTLLQLRTVTQAGSDYDVVAPVTSSQPVTLVLTNNATHQPSWAGSFAVSASTTTTVDVTGDASALANRLCAFDVGIASIRGAYAVRTPTSAVFNSPSPGLTRLTGFATPLPAAATGSVLPAYPHDDALRRAVFGFFDALGPGDTSPPTRWPTEDQQGRATLYRTALACAVLDVDGVLNAGVTVPVADLTPSDRVLFTLGKLILA